MTSVRADQSLNRASKLNFRRDMPVFGDDTLNAMPFFGELDLSGCKSLGHSSMHLSDAILFFRMVPCCDLTEQDRFALRWC